MYLDPFQTNLYLFYCCFLFEIMEITIDLGINSEEIFATSFTKNPFCNGVFIFSFTR